MQIFLSHSSKDKESYVKYVADKLGGRAIYDAYTFEAGMITFNEIKKHMSKTDLFVIFISNSALNSDWVQHELKIADENLGFNLKQIYPIIIDPSITHNDSRIPDWLKKYNLRILTKKQKIVSMIEQQMRELSWSMNPDYKKRDQVYKGRHDETKKFEERMDNIDMPIPRAVFAQGLVNIGRKTFLNATIKKALSKYNETYKPPKIVLDETQSIEDFILLIIDLGYTTQNVERSDIFIMNKQEKYTLAASLLKELNTMNDVLLIEDNGSIVKHDGKFPEWFIELLNLLKNMTDDLYLIIASRFSLYHPSRDISDYILNIDIPELSPSERLGLFKDYVEIFSIGDKVTRDDMHNVKKLLSGFPDQVRYLANRVKETSMKEVMNNSQDIVEYNNQQVYSFVHKYVENEIAFEFLLLLSNIDLISFELLEPLIEDNRTVYYDLLQNFFIEGLCARFGTDNEYFRVNDVIRDYIRRLKYGLPKTFKKKITASLDEFMKKDSFDESNLSEYFYFLQQALIDGKEIPEKFLLPSHFLRTIAQLYNTQQYSDVCEIAKRVLKHEDYMDNTIVFEIRHYYCSSLARQRDKTFLDEVEKITDYSEKAFLKGFYYRLLGKYKKALENLEDAMRQKTNFSRAKREKVQVYLNVFEYDLARNLAKENYLKWKDNLFHIHAYFIILLQDEYSLENKQKLEVMLNKLNDMQNASSKAREMYLECNALFTSHYLNQKTKAIEMIDNLILEYPKTIYPLLAKFDIVEKYQDIEEMRKTLQAIKSKEKSTHNLQWHTSIGVRTISYLTSINEKSEAKNELELLISKTGYSFEHIKNKYHL